ncbi:MAG: hypothetical protein JNL52_07195 [Flavobacteriales bacterium]|nr:hypothetical protein [Flavobacteriales bacterium]
MHPRLGIIILAHFSGSAVLGQGEAPWRTRLVLGGGITFQAPSLVGHTTPSAAALPLVGLALDLGAAFTHRDSWGIADQGGAAA